MSSFLFLCVLLSLLLLDGGRGFRVPLYRRRAVRRSTARAFSRESSPVESPNRSLGSEELLLASEPPRLPDLQPESLAIFGVYFVQGALGLSRLAVSFFLKDQLALSPADAAALMGLTSLPWLVKPLYGFLSDSFPLFGYRRRSYLFLAGLAGSVSWLAMAFGVTTAPAALAATLLGSLSVAVSDVVIDSIVVERTQERAKGEGGKLEQAGELQSSCWTASAVGGLCSAYFSGSLLEIFSPQTVFLITAIFPLFTALAACLVREASVSSLSPTSPVSAVLKSQSIEIWNTLKQPSIFLPVLFVFLWQATPSPESALFYFYTNALGFSTDFLGRLRLIASIASLVGVLTYRKWIKSLPLKSVLLWTSLASVPLGLSQAVLTSHLNRQLGLPDEVFALVDSAVLAVLGQISFMPVLALAAALCPAGIEGTLFASLMSIYNAAGLLGSELGAGLTGLFGVTATDFDKLTDLVVVCSLSSLLPLPFLNKLLGNQFDQSKSLSE
eukprot:gene2257-2471_t